MSKLFNTVLVAAALTLAVSAPALAVTDFVPGQASPDQNRIEKTEKRLDDAQKRIEEKAASGKVAADKTEAAQSRLDKEAATAESHEAKHEARAEANAKKHLDKKINKEVKQDEKKAEPSEE